MARRSRRFGAFQPMFDTGPSRDGSRWYLKLLNLYGDGPAAVQTVSRCLAKAKDKPSEIRAMLGSPDGWRPQLVGCAATLAAEVSDRPLDALVAAASSYSWVSPQLIATVSLVVPDELSFIEGAIIQLSDAKGAAALVAVADTTTSDTAQLASTDQEGGGEIAATWRAAIRQAFEDAQLPHDW